VQEGSWDESRPSARSTYEAEKAKLDERGIIHAIRTQRDLDEAPGAFKNIDEGMQYQKDLWKEK
jgi:tRNA-splicing ligase RtcB